MELKPTAKVAEALALAQRAAQSAGNPEITPDHLTSAIVQLDTAQADTLMRAKGDTYLALDLLLLALAETGHLAAVEKRGAKDLEAKIEATRGGRSVTSETPVEGGEALATYGTDLTQAARDGWHRRRPAHPRSRRGRCGRHGRRRRRGRGR